VLTSTVIAFVLQRFAQTADLAMIQLLGIVFVALRYNVKITLAASFFSIAFFDFLFIPPRLAFAWSDAKNIITFGGMVVVSAVISLLNERIRDQERVAREAARRTNALYDLQSELSTGTQVQQLIAVTKRHLERLFRADIAILLASPNRSLDLGAIGLSSEDSELATRAWARREFTTESHRGRFKVWYPLIGLREAFGAIGIAVPASFAEHSDSGLLFLACANQLANAIERTQLTTVVQRAQVEAETERMRSSLLSAVSHDLRTPLSTIVAAGTTLLDHGNSLSSDDARELVSAMVSESERLSRLVQNLLAATRLESSSIELSRTPEAIEELVSSAVHRIKATFASRSIDVAISADLPWVSVDPALVEQVLVNLLENAVRYSDPTTPIRVSAQLADQELVVQVADRGPGIPEEDIHKVFEKFYRGKAAQKRDGGAGLGLTICRAIVRLHGGRITILNRKDGGTVLEFTLPLAQPLQAQPAHLENPQ
jgi:two-component system sensor histidine kinase KdpD